MLRLKVKKDRLDDLIKDNLKCGNFKPYDDGKYATTYSNKYITLNYSGEFMYVFGNGVGVAKTLIELIAKNYMVFERD